MRQLPKTWMTRIWRYFCGIKCRRYFMQCFASLFTSLRNASLLWSPSQKIFQLSIVNVFVVVVYFQSNIDIFVFWWGGANLIQQLTLVLTRIAFDAVLETRRAFQPLFAAGLPGLGWRTEQIFLTHVTSLSTITVFSRSPEICLNRQNRVCQTPLYRNMTFRMRWPMAFCTVGICRESKLIWLSPALFESAIASDCMIGSLPCKMEYICSKITE